MNTISTHQVIPTNIVEPIMPKFSFRGVEVTYDQSSILKEFYFDVYGPGLCSIIGANGVGKTTLLKIASGLSLPTKGEVLVNGLSTADKWNEIRKEMGVSLYSERSYHFRLTGMQNLIYFGRLNGLRKKETLEKLLPLSQKFSIEPLLTRKFSELSLGQRKIFGIVVAFVLSGDIILLDEPTANLDDHNSLAVASMLEWAIEQNKTILITTHDHILIEQSQQVISL